MLFHHHLLILVIIRSAHGQPNQFPVPAGEVIIPPVYPYGSVHTIRGINGFRTIEYGQLVTNEQLAPIKKRTIAHQKIELEYAMVYCHKAISDVRLLPDWLLRARPFNFFHYGPLATRHQHQLVLCNLHDEICGVLQCHFGPGWVFIHQCIYRSLHYNVEIPPRCWLASYCGEDQCNSPTFIFGNAPAPPTIAQQIPNPTNLPTFTVPSNLPPVSPPPSKSRFGFMDMRNKQKKIDEFMDWRKN